MAQVGDLIVTGRATFVNGIRGEVNPLCTNTYTGLIGSENNAANASFYVGKFVPTSYDDIWKIKIRIVTVAAGRTDSRTVNECYIEGSRSVVNTYHNFNTYVAADYRPIYYINIYRATSAGVTSGYGHLLGVGFRDSWSRTTAANSRTVTVEILETVNCTYTSWDTAVKYASVPGTGSTNYSALSELDAYNAGLRETGDDNTYAHQVAWQYYANKTSANIGIWAGGLSMLDGSDRLMSICTASDGTATSSNRTTATTKKANTYGFKVGSPVFYSSQSYNKNVNIGDASKIFSQMGSLFDSRYAFNTTLTAGSLTAYAPIYLVGTINGSDGLFYLDTTWWTQTPNDSSKIYIYVGRCFDSTTSNCRIVLDQDNPWYRYEDGQLKKLCYGYLKDAGGTLWGSLTMNGSLDMNNNSISNVNYINSYQENTNRIRSNIYTVGSGSSRYSAANYIYNRSTSNAPFWMLAYDVHMPENQSYPSSGTYDRPIANFTSIPNTTGDLVVTNGAYAGMKHIAADKAISHNNIYRGEELLSSSHFGTGSTGLTALHNAVSAGNFSDIYVGDTITVTMAAISGYESASQTVVWVVMGIDIYLQQNIRWNLYENIAQHHLVLVPKDCFKTAQKWHTSDNITSVGYASSYMSTDVLPAYETAIKNSLGNYLLQALYQASQSAGTTEFSFYSGTNSGAANSGNRIATPWITLLNEVEILGYRTIASHSVWDIGIDNIWLPGFRLNPNLICKKDGHSGTNYVYWWLKVICSSSRVGAMQNATEYGPWAQAPTNNNYICPKIFFG